MIDLLYPDVLKNKIRANLEIINFLLKNLYNAETLDETEILTQYLNYAEKLKKYIADADILINKAIDSGKKVLLRVLRVRFLILIMEHILMLLLQIL